MHTVRSLLLLLHFVGFASLFGAVMMQMSASVRRVVPAMLHGLGTQLITGFALVFAVSADGDTLNHAKVGAKMLVLVVLFVAIFRARKKEALSAAEFYAIGGLTLLNAAIATLV